MEFTKLGNSDIEISRFCVGCMSFGDPASKMHEWTLNPQESENIIKHALDLGINFLILQIVIRRERVKNISAGHFGKIQREITWYLPRRFILMKENFLKKQFQERWMARWNALAQIILICW